MDIFTSPDTGETIALCHISTIISFTHGDYVQSRAETEDAFSIALALHHLNTGDGSIVPEVEGLNERCKVRFTFELADTQFDGGVAVRHVIDQTSRQLPDRIPCAFLGAFRSAVSIPMSIVTGVLGYPQISGASTSVDLDDSSRSPLFGRTVPSDEGNSVPIIIYMHEVLKLDHLAIIYQNDDYGNAFVRDLLRAAEEYAPNMLIQQIPLDEGDASIETAIASFKATGYRFVFCIAFTRETLDALMTEAYNNDVAGNGKHTWIFSDSFMGTLDDRMFEKDAPLTKAYSGVGMMEASGGVAGIPSYDEYASKMVQLKNPTDLNYIGALLPSYQNTSTYPTTLDDYVLFDDNYMEPISSGFSTFNYEAAIALGLAACGATEELGSLSIRGEDHFKAFLNTSFTGVVGSVILDPVTGTRLPTSTMYKVGNWLTEDVDDNRVVFKPIVSELFEEGVWVQQVPFVFNDGTTTVPVDIAPTDESSSVNLALAITLPIVAVVLIGLAVFLFTKKQRKQNDASMQSKSENPGPA